jgi:hypothetical protein
LAVLEKSNEFDLDGSAIGVGFRTGFRHRAHAAT